VDFRLYPGEIMHAELKVPERLAEDVVELLDAAYRKAMNSGRDTVDVILVLTEALTSRLRAPFPVTDLLGRAARARVNDPGAAEGWSSSGTASLASVREAAATLRECAWRAVRNDGGPRTGRPAWSAELTDALGRALDDARASGVHHAHGTHLLIGMLADPGGTASGLLAGSDSGGGSGVTGDPQAVLARLRASRHWTREGRAAVSIIDTLETTGGIASPLWWPLRLVPHMVGAALRRRQAIGGPIISGLETEAVRQAVRLGDTVVTTAHVLLAIVSLDELLAVDGRRLQGPAAGSSEGAAILRRNAVVDLLALAVGNTAEETQTMPPDEAAQRFLTGGRTGDPAWGYQALLALDRASTLAVMHDRAEPGTTHLLAALLDDKLGSAYRLLRLAGMDPEEIRVTAQRGL
jgi:hypothetical protein